MLYILLFLTAGGIYLLAASLPSVRAILRTLGSGELRTRWQWLSRLIVAFLVGYVVFGGAHLFRPVSVVELIVATILFAGGGFVLIVARLSDMTTRDIVRIASLERDAMHDPLTGVYNRRYLASRLDEELSRARRAGRPLSALMIDLDYFKHINDAYGHPVGDQVLQHVSALIMSQVRVNDLVVRYGGEEFVVITPDVALEDASLLGERLLDCLRGQQVSLADGRALAVTASIGVATLNNDECQATLLRRADHALYAAKKSGRNRLCTAGKEKMAA